MSNNYLLYEPVFGRERRMEPFNRNSYCPKCWSIDISSNWFPYDYNRWLNHNTIPAAKEKREHIRRTCERCHYVWNEAPLDVEGGTGNENNA